jgi:hypothetical protein
MPPVFLGSSSAATFPLSFSLPARTRALRTLSEKRGGRVLSSRLCCYHSRRSVVVGHAAVLELIVHLRHHACLSGQVDDVCEAICVLRDLREEVKVNAPLVTRLL